MDPVSSLVPAAVSAPGRPPPRRGRRRLLAPLLLSLSLFIVMAATLFSPVRASTCTVPGEYGTIQAAVDDSACTVIRVAAGTYTENVSIARSVEIHGAGAGSTIVDGGAAGPVLDVESGATVVISGTLVRNGQAQTGAGIRNYGTLTLNNSAVRQNNAELSGAGILNGGSLTVTDSLIELNALDGSISRGGGLYNSGQATLLGGTRVATNTVVASQSYGGGIYNGGTLWIGEVIVAGNVVSASVTGGGGLYNDGQVTLEATLVRSNVMTASIGYGSGIHNTESMTATLVTVQANTMSTSIGRGGGLYNTGETAIFTAGSLSGNAADDDGGGLYNSGLLTLADTEVNDNLAGNGGAVYNSGTLIYEGGRVENNGSTGNAGGLANQSGATVMATDTTFIDNWATGNGGAIYNFGDLTLDDLVVSRNSATDGGGIFSEGVLTATGVHVLLNGAELGDGAGLYSEGPANISHATFYANGAGEDGGGVYQAAGVLTASNVTWHSNSSTLEGGALYLGADATANILNATVVTNTAVGAGSGGLFLEAGALATIENSIVAASDNANCSGDGAVTSAGYNLESADHCGFAATGDLTNADPRVGPLTFNGGPAPTMALGEGSPALNAANAASCPPTDARRVPRPIGAGCDIGAYEALLLAIEDSSQVEGGSGTTTAVFTVTTGAPVPGPQSITAAYRSTAGTATEGLDYQAISGTITIPAGNNTRTITVTILGDTLDETTEAFGVELSSPVRALLEDGEALGSIVDDDGPEISIAGSAVVEGNSGTTAAVFTVTLSAASVQTVTVEYVTADGTATAPGDYTPVDGTLTFAPGETTATVSVPVVGDSTVEPDETFAMRLSNAANATITTGEATGTIVNDDEEVEEPAWYLYVPLLRR